MALTESILAPQKPENSFTLAEYREWARENGFNFNDSFFRHRLDKAVKQGRLQVTKCLIPNEEGVLRITKCYYFPKNNGKARPVETIYANSASRHRTAAQSQKILGRRYDKNPGEEIQ